MITKQVDGQTKKWLFNNLWFGRFERSLNQNDTIGGFRQMCRNLKVSRTTRLITKNAIEGFDQLFRPLIFEFWNRYFNKNIIYVYFSLFNLSKSVNNCLLRQLMQSSAMGIFRVLITPKSRITAFSLLVLGTLFYLYIETWRRNSVEHLSAKYYLLWVYWTADF